MPHFVIECSEELLEDNPANEIIELIFETAKESGLFRLEDIKVRIMPYHYYTVAGERSDFLHVFAYIMEGRTIEQKQNLSKRIVSNLIKSLPDVPVISLNVIDFEKSTYNNRRTISN